MEKFSTSSTREGTTRKSNQIMIKDESFNIKTPYKFSLQNFLKKLRIQTEKDKEINKINITKEREINKFIILEELSMIISNGIKLKHILFEGIYVFLSSHI